MNDQNDNDDPKDGAGTGQDGTDAYRAIVERVDAAPVIPQAEADAATGDGEPGDDSGDEAEYIPDDGMFEEDGDPGPDFNPEDATLIACAGEPANDIGNGRRLLHRHGKDIIHIQRIAWFAYDSVRWVEDIDGRALRPFAHDVAERIAYEPIVIPPTRREQEAIAAGDAAHERWKELNGDLAGLIDQEMTAEKRKREGSRIRFEMQALKDIVAEGRAARKSWSARKSARKRFGLSSGNTGKMDAMIGEAKPFRSRPLDHCDADGMKFNVQNGTLHFVQVEVEDLDNPEPDSIRMKKEWQVILLPHDRDDMITKLAPVTWDPDATAPIYEAFINRIMPQPDVRAFTQRSLGLSLTGVAFEQCFWIFFGDGSNGKSTLTDAVAEVIGDYAVTIPIMSLVNDQPRAGGQPTPDLNHLPGSRFVRASEPKAGMPLDESLIKQLTGGEPIVLRRLNQESTEIRPKFKLYISANKKPAIYGDDEGIWRRVYLVPFTVQIPKGERDKRLPEKLKAEASGILNWLIAGLLDYLNRGSLAPPEEVLAATQDYRDESDDFGLFIRDALDVTRNPADTETPGALYVAYKNWCSRAVKTAVKESVFTRRMPAAAERAGFEKHKASTSSYAGVRIREGFGTKPAPPHSPDDDMRS
jgi:putative DNA primase/helicase